MADRPLWPSEKIEYDEAVAMPHEVFRNVRAVGVRFAVPKGKPRPETSSAWGVAWGKLLGQRRSNRVAAALSAQSGLGQASCDRHRLSIERAHLSCAGRGFRAQTLGWPQLSSAADSEPPKNSLARGA